MDGCSETCSVCKSKFQVTELALVRWVRHGVWCCWKCVESIEEEGE